MPKNAIRRAGETALAAGLAVLTLCGVAAAQPPLPSAPLLEPQSSATPTARGPTVLSPPNTPLANPPGAAASGMRPGLLTEPPAEAHAGECYARVRVPGEPLYAPAGPPEAVWALTPGVPGQGPMWCLTYRPGARPLAGYSPERVGWIRVVCAHKVTPALVRRVQRRLRVWDCYRGRITGRLDARTRAGVVAFQARRRLRHGGYLSQTTLTTLDAAPAQAPPLLIPAAGVTPCALRTCGPVPAPPPGGPGFSQPTTRPLLSWSGKSLY